MREVNCHFGSYFAKTAKSYDSLICGSIQALCSTNQEKDFDYYLVDFQILVNIAF